MLFRRPRRHFAELIRTTVVVHLRSGESIAGVMLDEYDDCIVLVRARVLDAGGGKLVALDGEQLIRWENIRWAQAGVAIDDLASSRELHLRSVEANR